MRKLVWLADMSLDGFMCGPNGEMSWAAPCITDELWDDVNELLRTVDTALFGRVTYENFEQYWPAVPGNPASPKPEVDFARWIDETPKLVASKTLSGVSWKNSTLLDDVAGAVVKLKDQPGKSVLMFGSCNLALQLLVAGHIDEMQLRIHPLFMGVGRPLFKRGVPHTTKLVQARTFRSGLVRLQYVL